MKRPGRAHACQSCDRCSYVMCRDTYTQKLPCDLLFIHACRIVNHKITVETYDNQLKRRKAHYDRSIRASVRPIARRKGRSFHCPGDRCGTKPGSGLKSGPYPPPTIRLRANLRRSGLLHTHVPKQLRYALCNTPADKFGRVVCLFRLTPRQTWPCACLPCL